jgi:hypothetical protein
MQRSNSKCFCLEREAWANEDKGIPGHKNIKETVKVLSPAILCNTNRQLTSNHVIAPLSTHIKPPAF